MANGRPCVGLVGLRLDVRERPSRGLGRRTPSVAGFAPSPPAATSLAPGFRRHSRTLAQGPTPTVTLRTGHFHRHLGIGSSAHAPLDRPPVPNGIPPTTSKTGQLTKHTRCVSGLPARRGEFTRGSPPARDGVEIITLFQCREDDGRHGEHPGRPARRLPVIGDSLRQHLIVCPGFQDASQLRDIDRSETRDLEARPPPSWTTRQQRLIDRFDRTNKKLAKHPPAMLRHPPLTTHPERSRGRVSRPRDGQASRGSGFLQDGAHSDAGSEGHSRTLAQPSSYLVRPSTSLGFVVSKIGHPISVRH